MAFIAEHKLHIEKLVPDVSRGEDELSTSLVQMGLFLHYLKFEDILKYVEIRIVFIW